MSKMPLISSIYNPQNQTKEGLINNFVVRIKTFQRLFKEIEEVEMKVPEQHHLIVGKRGMGKTTLLLRLAYEVEKSEKLNAWLVPLVFNEEEYGIRKLYKFWVRVAELLEAKTPAFQGISTEIELLSEQYQDDEAYEKEVFALLAAALKKQGKKVILFIDNVGDIFSRFSDYEAHRLRKILQTSVDIRIIAASSKLIESFFKYEHPFYEFFKMTHLKGLNQKETEDLLLNLGKVYQQRSAIQDIIQYQKGRISTLRKLTGGVIRTVVLLFEIFLDEKNGSAFSDLEAVLDRVTPLYKHRMDDLPKQQQEIVEAIALHWMAITVKEIKQKTRMESKVISAQLTQLVKNGVINRIPTTTKNHLYQLNERFFNIWYLMRCGRQRNKNSVLWLVKFFESWCRNEKEITDRVQKHIDYLKAGEYDVKAAYYVTEALSGVGHLPSNLQHILLEETRKFLNQKNSELAILLSDSDNKILDKIKKAISDNNSSKMIQFINKLKGNNKFFLLGWVNEKHLKNRQNAIEYYLKALNTKGKSPALLSLGMLYFKEEKYSMAESYLLEAAKLKNEKSYSLLGIIYFKTNLKDLHKAKKYLELALDTRSHKFFTLVAGINHELGFFEETEKYLIRAIEEQDEKAILLLAKLYNDKFKNSKKAEKYYRLGIEKNIPKSAHHLAHLLQKINKDESKEVEKLFKQSIKLGDETACGCLGNYYIRNKQYKKAIPFLEKAVNIGSLPSALALGHLYTEKYNNWEKSNYYFIKAIKINKNSKEDLSNQMEWMINSFLYLLSWNKFDILLEFFEDKKDNLKEEFQPIYFALMYYLQDQYPNEYLRMGEELKETVEEIIAEVEELKKNYD